jgi:hypothetical protein
LRLRFDERELSLLRGAEQVRGASLAHNPRPEVLRSALALARTGHKLAHAAPRVTVSLEEPEVRLLIEALRFAIHEVHWVGDQSHADEVAAAADRRATVLRSFPELTERGLWRTFGVCRELDALGSRLQRAVSS